MASVAKHPRSRYWTAIYKDASNKWVRKTTKRTKKTDALLLAATWERQGERARQDLITEAACERAVDAAFEAATGRKRRKTTVREFLKRYSDEKNQPRYEGTIRRFLEAIGQIADQSINELTPDHCALYHTSRREIGIAPATLSVEWKIIRAALARAKRDGLICSNPTDPIALPKKFNQVKRDTFTHEEIEMLLREAGPEWQTAIHLGYYAGLRLSDSISLTWDNVDFDKTLLRLVVKKTGESLTVPMHPSLESHLLSIAADHAGPLCPTLSAVPISGRSGLSKQFLALMRKCGLDSRPVQTAGQRQLARRSFHCLRLTFNSTLHNEGVSQEVRKKLTGHKSDAINDRYTRTELGTLSSAVSKLPATAKKSNQLELGLE